jgi:APA family basic amino acid/polyamine antiporter
MSIWKKKSLESMQADIQNQSLQRTLGPLNLIMIGVGAIIGAGLFSITGVAAAENAGPAIVISFILAAIACAFAGLCYSELASVIPVAGSAYTYAYATMGEFVAWLIGWTLILEYAIGAVTVSISWSAYVVSLLEDMGIRLPTQLIASPWQPVMMPDNSLVYGWINLPAVLIVMFLSCMLIWGMRQSTRLNAILVVIKVAVVVAFIAIGFFYIDYANYIPFIPENTGTFGEYGWSGIMRAAGIVFFAYIGFDSVSTAAQEAKNPQRTLPIGIIGSLIICTVLFILFAFVMTGLVPYQLLDVAAPVAVAIEQTPFPWLAWAIKLAILAGLSSVILVLLFGQSRIFYAMSCDGLIPPAFSRIHRRFFTPWLSNLVLMVFVAGLGAFAPIALVGAMTSIGTLFAFAIVCAGVLVLRRTQPNLHRPFKTPWVPLVPLLGIASCLLMMASLGIGSWIRLLIWLFIGLLIYLFYGKHHSILNQR